jgi:hypothetical protein
MQFASLSTRGLWERDVRPPGNADRASGKPPFPSLVCHHRAHALGSHATRDEGSRTNRVNRIGTHARKYCFPFCKNGCPTTVDICVMCVKGQKLYELV